MKIDSPRFGTLDVEPARIIEFPRGLPGFEDLHRFSLFHPEGNEPEYFLLQSLDDPGIVFTIADPSRFGFAFEINLTDEEASLLQLRSPGDIVVAVMLIRDDSAAPMRANLNAPLVIDVESRRGLQHVFTRLDYTVTIKG